MNNKQLEKKRKRAVRERDIVAACATKMDEKIAVTTKDRADAKRQVEFIEGEILRLADLGEEDIVIQRLVDERDFERKRIDFADGLLDVFFAVRTVLLNLVAEIDAVLRFEWYEYVIKILPEKKLPKLVRSEQQEDLLKVMQLTQTILQKIEEKVSATLVDKQEFQKEVARIKDVSAEIKKRCVGESSRSVQSAVEEIRNRGKKSTVLPVPVKAAGVEAEPTNPYVIKS